MIKDLLIDQNEITLEKDDGTMTEKVSCDVSIVIPAFNEEQRIGDSLTKIIRYFRQKKVSFEIIVVDDGSGDRTVEVCKEKMSTVSHKILVNGRNRGKGFSVRQGVFAAGGKIILFTDADLSTPIEEFDKLVKGLEGGDDMVFGSRALQSSQVELHQSWFRETMGRVFNAITNQLVFRGIYVHDSQCGFKAFKRAVAQRLFERQRLDSFCFDVEVIYLAQKMNYRISEIGIRWVNSPESKVRIFTDSLRMLIDLFRIRILHLGEKYCALNMDARRAGFILTAILVLGFLLRIIGIHFGLPHLYHADESIVVNHALAYGTGDLNPHFFKIPPLVSYLLFISYGVYYLFGRGVGIFSGLEDFQYLFLTNPSSFYLIARVLIGALLGASTIYLLFRLARTFLSMPHAVLSAFLLGVNFLHVRDSHYVYADIPLVLILVASFFPIFRILEDEGNWMDYTRFGGLVGAAVAIKYNGVFIFAPFLVAHVLKMKNHPSKASSVHLLIAGCVSLLTYSVLNPFSWLDFNFFLSELHTQAGAESFTGFLHHLTYSLNGGLGFPVLSLSLFGMGILLFRQDAKRFVLFSFIFVYCCVLCFFAQPYDRYVLPLIPFFILFAADGFLAVVNFVPLRNVGVFVLFSVLLISPAAKIFLSNALFTRKDVRTVAQEWIEQNIPAQSKVALDVAFFVPRLKPSLAQLKEKADETAQLGGLQRKRIELLTKQAQESLAPRYHLFFLGEAGEEKAFLFSKPTLPYKLESLKEHGIDYVILCSFHENFEAQFRKELEREAELLKTFSPYKDPAQEWTIDSQPLTGGPFLWKDLAARKANGLFLKLYRLK